MAHEKSRVDIRILTHISKMPNGLAIVLMGPEPFKDFVSDGCTMSPDFWWRGACVVHDYEYHLARLVWEEREAYKVQQNKWSDPRVNQWYALNVEMARLKRKAKNMRKVADRNLKENIRRCSKRAGVSGVGRWFAYHIAARIYYRAVRAFGSIRGKGHKGN